MLSDLPLPLLIVLLLVGSAPFLDGVMRVFVLTVARRRNCGTHRRFRQRQSLS